MDENKGKYIALPVLAVAICLAMILLDNAEVALPPVFRVAMVIAVLLLIVIYMAIKRSTK